MKIGQLFVFALIIAVSSAFIQNGKNSGRFFGLSSKSRHEEPLLRTFSLSVVGDFGFANISNFFIKIFEAISQCKFSIIVEVICSKNSTHNVSTEQSSCQTLAQYVAGQILGKFSGQLHFRPKFCEHY